MSIYVSTSCLGGESGYLEKLEALARAGIRNIELGICRDPGLDLDEVKKMKERFAQTIEAFFRAGGQQTQFNIMTYEMLLDAKKNPTKYPELMVRVSGYSAYFKDLNEKMKDELITRTQYDLSRGKAVPFPE